MLVGRAGGNPRKQDGLRAALPAGAVTLPIGARVGGSLTALTATVKASGEGIVAEATVINGYDNCGDARGMGGWRKGEKARYSGLV